MQAWPPNATDEARSLRRFKDALMKHGLARPWSSASGEAERVADLAASEVEDAYARVREHAPEAFENDSSPPYAQILTSLRDRGAERDRPLPPRRVLVHTLAGLDYYFFKLTSGHERVYDMPHLSEEERAAEHGLRHDLLLELYEELEPAFDVSLSWPPRGYEMDDNGDLIRAESPGMEEIGYDDGYDALVFHEGHADDDEYVRGFVEGCLERIAEEDSEGASLLGNLWRGGDSEGRASALEMLKEECEVKEGRFDDRPKFPV